MISVILLWLGAGQEWGSMALGANEKGQEIMYLKEYQVLRFVQLV